MTTDYHDTGRYGVVRYWDAKGVFYAVVDKQHPGMDNIVYTSRGRNAAHKHAANLQAARP